MIEQVKKLIVKYNGRIVGYLAELQNKQIAFQYEKDWINHGFAISPFSLPLSSEVYICKKQTFDGLFGVFWDCLPDGWGELLVRRMLLSKGVNPDKLTPLQRLSILSHNGLGALEFEPCHMDNEAVGHINLDTLAIESKKLLNEDNNNVHLDELYKLGGSSGGARPKAHIKDNGEEWIVKFPCLIDPIDIGKKEFEVNSLAKKCGINVSEFKLFDSEICSGYFGTKRFDRKKDKKVHMISLSAILETSHRVPNLDYIHLFQVIESICVDKNDIYEAYKRMCFNVFIKNRDDHSKNFAFLYDENLGGYKLSPAYDLTSLPNKLEHEMTVNGKAVPNEKDLLEFADLFNLLKEDCIEIIEKIKKVLDY